MRFVILCEGLWRCTRAHAGRLIRLCNSGPMLLRFSIICGVLRWRLAYRVWAIAAGIGSMNRALGVLRRVSSLRLCGLIAADSCVNEALVDSLDYDGLGNC